MPRLLLVDDSPSVRQLLATRLENRGYDVSLAPDALAAAELALQEPPDVVVTDMWMPGVSGVQLCRLLRAEPRTAHVPVVLITAASQRRSRFWAKTAGAVGYVAKDDAEALYAVLERVAIDYPPVPPASIRVASRTPMQHRLFERLDLALFESVIAGQVRALANGEAEARGVFHGLVDLLSEAAGFAWIALRTDSPRLLFFHAHPDTAAAAERDARAALGAPLALPLEATTDDRALREPAGPAIVGEVRSMGKQVGTLAVGPTTRGASSSDYDLVRIVSAELGGPLGIVALVEDTRRLAMTDPLTGLLNRRAFLDLATRELATLARHHEPLSILMLDLDHFKRVNDTYGHDAGDAVLVGVAGVLRSVARATDFVARWGGEEFIVGLSRTGAAACLTPAERIRQCIHEHAFKLDDVTLTMSASIGVTTALHGEGVDALVTRADRALYQAKAKGRNRCEALHGDERSPAHRRSP